MLLKIHPDNPQLKKLEKAISILKNGGVIIYPTDTAYGIGCDIFNKKAVERICRIKNIEVKKHNFSFICHDLSHISDFTKFRDIWPSDQISRARFLVLHIQEMMCLHPLCLRCLETIQGYCWM